MNLRQLSASVTQRLTQHIGIDIPFYGRSLAWMTLGYGSGVIRGISTTFFMARWLPSEVLGQFRYILAIFGIAGVFSLSGINASIIRGISRGDTIIAHRAFKRILRVAPLGSVFLFGASFERYLHHEPMVSIGMGIAAVLFPFYCVSGLYGSILTGKGDVAHLVKISVINNLVFASCFFCVLWNARTLLPIVLAYFGFDVMFRGYITWKELRRLPALGNPDDHLLLGSHLSAIGVLQTFASQLDNILIQRFGGYSSLATYSVATLLPEQIKDFVNAMNGVILQRFSRHKATEKILQQTKKHFRNLLLVSVCIVLVYSISIPYILPWLFPQYRDQVFPSIVYAFGLLALPSLIGVNFLQAHNQIRRLWAYYTANTALQIITNITLIPLFGSWGGILSKTSTRLCSFLLSYPQLTRKKTPDTPPESSSLQHANQDS